MYKHEKAGFIFLFVEVVWFKGCFSHNNYLSIDRKVLICSTILAKLTSQPVNWMAFFVLFFALCYSFGLCLIN